MAYRVDISPSALADAEEAYLWLKDETSTERAGEWYEGLLQTIFSLEILPTRCPLAPESEDLGIELRQLLYGKRRNVYRILFGFGLDQKTGEEVVRIYRIRHSRRQYFEPDEIREGEPKDEE